MKFSTKNWPLNKLSTYFWEAISVIPMTLQMPYIWLRSLIHSHVLLQGKWSNYMGFEVNSSFNNLFYRTQWINLNKYGTKGTSKEIGLGSYKLHKWFHISILSSYIFANSAAVTTLAGTLITFASFTLFSNSYSYLWVIAVTFFATISSSVFSMAFYRQNYQILGWIWIPSAYYELHNGELKKATFFFLVSSVFAMTPVVLSILPVLSGSGFIFDSKSYFAFILPLTLISLYVLKPWSKNLTFKSLTEIAKLIGAIQRKSAKYVRHSMRLNIFLIYFCIVNTIAYLILSYKYEKMMLPILAIIFTAVVNELFVRIADFESVIMIELIILLTIIITQKPNPLSILVLWIVFYYPLKSLGIKTNGKYALGLRIKAMHPVDISKVLDSLNLIFQKMDTNRKVFMVFRNPKNIYEDIFDGFRNFIEAPIYIANINNFHCIPDWYLIAETNYANGKEFWCNDDLQLKQISEELNKPYLVFFKWQNSKVDFYEKYRLSTHNVSLLGEINFAEILEKTNVLKKVDAPIIEIWG